MDHPYRPKDDGFLISYLTKGKEKKKKKQNPGSFHDSLSKLWRYKNYLCIAKVICKKKFLTNLKLTLNIFSLNKEQEKVVSHYLYTRSGEMARARKHEEEVKAF